MDEEDEEAEDEEKGPELVETVLASLTPGKVCCTSPDLENCVQLGL